MMGYLRWVFIVLVFIRPTVGGADVYKYVDQQGTVHFSDTKRDKQYNFHMKAITSPPSVSNEEDAVSGSMAETRIVGSEPQGVPPLKVVCFIPSDMAQRPDSAYRLGRVMRYIQGYFRKEMVANGYGPMTFALEWSATDKLKLYEVRGGKKHYEYNRGHLDVIRGEVRDALKSQYGIEADKEYLIIFQLTRIKEGLKSDDYGYGEGTSVSGTVWVYDEDRLDPELFTCGHIGTVAHEIGHALGLPHDSEWDSERRLKGRSLMSYGPHHLGREFGCKRQLKFLSESSALQLSVCRAFAGHSFGSTVKPNWSVGELTAREGQRDEQGRQTIVFSGRVSASPRLLGIIAYIDNLNIPKDYDAKTWMTKKLDSNGRFHITVGELNPAPYELRLVGVHENGATSCIARIKYEVTRRGIDMNNINNKFEEIWRWTPPNFVCPQYIP